MKFYVIAGEASGDLHGANLIRALREEAPKTQFRAWGGELMENAGAEVIKNYRELAFMGFIEVILNLKTILRNIRFCKEDIAAYRPDAVILIDYPGFNLRIATWCREQGIPVYYYISPQIWAWKENRVKRIKRDVTRMFVILPFEKAFYAKHGMEVEFVGHPLLDAITDTPSAGQALRTELNIEANQKLIALLPGSRKQEIKTMLPVMIKAMKDRNDCKWVVAGAPGQEESFYREVLGENQTPIIFGKTYALFQAADAGLVTSGTATLEAALHNMPMAVCYKGSALSYQIARRLIKVKFISLVNLILDREAVRELIQNDMRSEVLRDEIAHLLDDRDYRDAQEKAFIELREKLGGKGASKRAAMRMLKTHQRLENHSPTQP